MSLTQKQMLRAIKAMERAADLLAPVVAAFEQVTVRDNAVSTAARLRSQLRDEASYLQQLTESRTSWLYRCGVLK